jgi:hypothetical protein
MLTDHERVLLKLKAHIASKGSHGQRELLGLIGKLEVECSVEEGLPERALRLYGNMMSEDFLGRLEQHANTEAVAGRSGDA